MQQSITLSEYLQQVTVVYILKAKAVAPPSLPAMNNTKKGSFHHE